MPSVYWKPVIFWLDNMQAASLKVEILKGLTNTTSLQASISTTFPAEKIEYCARTLDSLRH